MYHLFTRVKQKIKFWVITPVCPLLKNYCKLSAVVDTLAESNSV